MARVTVEDCIDKVESPYQLVLVAKERTAQLNSGVEPTVDEDNDKNTVIALREIAAENVKVPDLTKSAVYKLRKHVEQIDDSSENETDIGDDFENIYKGEISKSGTPILPSKRARKTPEKLQVSAEDVDQLKGLNNSNLDTSTEESSEVDVSLDELSESETKEAEANPEDTETTNT
jgi:DNA-directed RNA polymerase subunit omega